MICVGGGPAQVDWNRFYFSNGAAIEAGWDLKPALWAPTAEKEKQPRLWNPTVDRGAPIEIWYSGHIRPGQDNFSRDVFAFTRKEPDRWVSREESIFSRHGDWPRAAGNYLGHRYGHQFVMAPRSGLSGRSDSVATVFYEEVTAVQADGSPQTTKIFMDEMVSPYEAKGAPVELVSPINPATRKPFPSAVRETGASLVEGPLYFRFRFMGEEWEAIGFSAGSYYANYPSCFAARRVSDGLAGRPFQIDLSDDGTDLHNAAAGVVGSLDMAGGPGRPSVIVDNEGRAVVSPEGNLQILLHGYDRRANPKTRVTFYAHLKISVGREGVLRFEIVRARPGFAKPVADESGPAALD